MKNINQYVVYMQSTEPFRSKVLIDNGIKKLKLILTLCLLLMSHTISGFIKINHYQELIQRKIIICQGKLKTNLY